jgi:hypothetical protein
LLRIVDAEGVERPAGLAYSQVLFNETLRDVLPGRNLSIWVNIKSLRLFENNCVYIDTTHNKGDANMLIDIHRAANVERHNYLLDQAEGWQLEKLANLIRRTRNSGKENHGFLCLLYPNLIQLPAAAWQPHKSSENFQKWPDAVRISYAVRSFWVFLNAIIILMARMIPAAERIAGRGATVWFLAYTPGKVS